MDVIKVLLVLMATTVVLSAIFVFTNIELLLVLMAGSAVLSAFFVFKEKYKVGVQLYYLTFVLYLSTLALFKDIFPTTQGLIFFLVWSTVPFLLWVFSDEADKKRARKLSALIFLLLTSIAIGLMMYHINQFDSHAQSRKMSVQKELN